MFFLWLILSIRKETAACMRVVPNTGPPVNFTTDSALHSRPPPGDRDKEQKGIAVVVVGRFQRCFCVCVLLPSEKFLPVSGTPPSRLLTQPHARW